ncbi:MAG: asparagine synthase-related protein [bacterium]
MAIARIQETLRRSVKKRLMSDVPIGVFLSGGLDSSIVAALMKEQIDELHSFSVGISDSPDLKTARIAAEHIGTIHHEYIYSEAEMTKVLSDVIYHLESYDPALVRSALPCYFVSKLASQYVKVILSGEGSDELFAGYSYFNDYDDASALQRESIRIINGLHNLNLQRVDRMTMAHGLEGRVPFLDIEFIETVLSIDPLLKMYRTFGIEKGLLRKAFEGMLPKEIVWRDKMEFAQGCGSSTVFQQKAEYITEEELEKAKSLGAPVSSKEELFYYDIFRRFFDHPVADKLVGRWQGELH